MLLVQLVLLVPLDQPERTEPTVLLDRKVQRVQRALLVQLVPLVPPERMEQTVQSDPKVQ